MRWLKKKLRAKSATQQCLPYSYEARVAITDPDFEYLAYYSDTICSLVEYLDQHNIRPDKVSFYELYHDHKAPLTQRLYTDDRIWLEKAALCELFLDYYKSNTKRSNKCVFEKRDNSTRGPQKVRRQDAAQNYYNS